MTGTMSDVVGEVSDFGNSGDISWMSGDISGDVNDDISDDVNGGDGGISDDVNGGDGGISDDAASKSSTDASYSAWYLHGPCLVLLPHPGYLQRGPPPCLMQARPPIAADLHPGVAHRSPAPCLVQ